MTVKEVKKREELRHVIGVKKKKGFIMMIFKRPITEFQACISFSMRGLRLRPREAMQVMSHVSRQCRDISDTSTYYRNEMLARLQRDIKVNKEVGYNRAVKRMEDQVERIMMGMGD